MITRPPASIMIAHSPIRPLALSLLLLGFLLAPWLCAQSITTTRTLAWEDPNPRGTIDGYCVYRGQIIGTNTNWVKIAFTTNCTYSLSITQGTWALFVVTTTNSLGETEFSNTAGGWAANPVITTIHK